MTGGANAAIVRRLFDALHAQDLDALTELLDPAVVVTSLKGTFHGPAEVRRWATKSDDGHLYSQVHVDEVDEFGDYVAVGARRQWRWRETDEVGDEAPFGSLFRVCDGRVVDWRQHYDSIIDAIDAIPAQ